GDVHITMRLVSCGDPAFEIAAVKLCTTVTIDMHVLRNAFLQTRSRHDELECRPGSQLRLDSFIHQRMVRIGYQRTPLLVRNADREVVGVEGRAADHRKDLAILRVHCYDRTVLVTERLFRSNLELHVN